MQYEDHELNSTKFVGHVELQSLIEVSFSGEVFSLNYPEKVGLYLDCSPECTYEDFIRYARLRLAFSARNNEYLAMISLMDPVISNSYFPLEVMDDGCIKLDSPLQYQEEFLATYLKLSLGELYELYSSTASSLLEFNLWSLSDVKDIIKGKKLPKKLDYNSLGPIRERWSTQLALGVVGFKDKKMIMGKPEVDLVPITSSSLRIGDEIPIPNSNTSYVILGVIPTGSKFNVHWVDGGSTNGTLVLVPNNNSHKKMLSKLMRKSYTDFNSPLYNLPLGTLAAVPGFFRGVNTNSIVSLAKSIKNSVE